MAHCRVENAHAVTSTRDPSVYGISFAAHLSNLAKMIRSAWILLFQKRAASRSHYWIADNAAESRH